MILYKQALPTTVGAECVWVLPVDMGEPTEVDVSCVIHGGVEIDDGVCWVSDHQNARTPCEFSGRLALMFDSERMT